MQTKGIKINNYIKMEWKVGVYLCERFDGAEMSRYCVLLCLFRSYAVVQRLYGKYESNSCENGK